MKRLPVLDNQIVPVSVELACRPDATAEPERPCEIRATPTAEDSYRLTVSIEGTSVLELQQVSTDSGQVWEQVQFFTAESRDWRDALIAAQRFGASRGAALITTTMQAAADSDDLLCAYFDAGFYPLSLH